jgi:redox-sensing transcriptional repressor
LIQPLDELEETVRRRRVDLAIVTVPAQAAQEVADRLVRAGVRAIWNFATTTLRVPSHVYVRNEHISVGLGDIAHQLSESGAGKASSRRTVCPPRRTGLRR